VSRRSRSEAGITYARNEHAFDVIDNEHAAYWLGFILADGNVSNGRLRIGLSRKDEAHVRKFAAWLAPQMPIYSSVNNSGRPVSTIDIGSKYLVETLSQYGVVPRKTYLLKSLPDVSTNLMRHLIRGYIDADGYFGIRASGTAFFGVSAYNIEIVEAIQDWFMQELDFRRTALIHSRAVWHYRQGGNTQTRAVAKCLYEGASIYLDRKYALAQRILAAGIVRPVLARIAPPPPEI
jgi:intein-encoded DNA endonuclease-like protein